jgi:hypothetical protein
MTSKLLSENSSKAIAAINNLVTPNAIKLTLKMIAGKILH